MKRSLLFSALLSLAVAQGDYRSEGSGYDDGGYRDYAGGRDDNVYAGYAANAVAGRGWGRVLVAGVGGYLLGAKVHTRRLKKSVPRLRFRVKQRVKCNMGSEGWSKGTVFKVWSEPYEKGHWIPYVVRLDDGREIYAPHDDDQVIRAEPRGRKSVS
mmetsp:Transcript_23739/g.47178  ORF Transcript_23739/g.47178 Transcript_23739/m.47178 type:complete len:156 (+) Transcript_23739:127-594(+)